MAITLQVNPTSLNPNSGKLYRSALQFKRTLDYPTRIRQPGSRTPLDREGDPGFLNLIVATGESGDGIKNDPFLLTLKDHKIFVLRRRFSEGKLYIWCIVRKKDISDRDPIEELEPEFKKLEPELEPAITGNLVLTIETEDESIESGVTGVPPFNTPVKAVGSH